MSDSPPAFMFCPRCSIKRSEYCNEFVYIRDDLTKSWHGSVHYVPCYISQIYNDAYNNKWSKNRRKKELYKKIQYRMRLNEML